jgi:hypothetical protein
MSTDFCGVSEPNLIDKEPKSANFSFYFPFKFKAVFDCKKLIFTSYYESIKIILILFCKRV